MSDVFISYARSTEQEAKQVTDALRALGYGVWRDDELPAHRAYTKVIDEKLRAAKAVVVVWSTEAVDSDWVQSEADRARLDRKLVQLSIDGAQPPMPFDRIQCADLTAWSGDLAAPGWRKVVASVAELCRPAPGLVQPSASAAPSTCDRAILSTDVEGASLLWLNHRAAMQDGMVAYQATIRAEAARHGGDVFRVEGETLYAAFALPRDAVAAAVAAQRALAAQAFPGVGALKARMAIHFGSVERSGGDYFGPPLGRCLKLLALSQGGQLLVTQAVADSLSAEPDPHARLRALGPHVLDDPLNPVALHQVLAEGLPQDFAPLGAPQDHANNLPRRPGRLIGREGEMAQIASLFEQVDLITVIGPGGVGKTRIAVEFAHSQLGAYEDGAWLVELAPVADPGQVTSAVARAMNIQLPPGPDPVGALVERLRPRHCLILLDNCEHVIDAVAGLAEALLEHTSTVKLLASSQEMLGIEGERVFRLPSLGEADAVNLFTERATAADTGFAVRPHDATAVAAICRRLDGIPLAVEMAAARAPSLGCDGVLQRLDDRFRILTGGRRTALPRQRTLQATLDWSHALLGEADAAVFRRLGVFTGGFTLEAASDVAADEQLDSYGVVDALSDLVAKSLVAADTGDNRTRYRLLETTRAYALEKLAAAGETQATQRRHAEYFIKFMTPARADYYSLNDDAYYARYAPEIDNVGRAVDWAFGPTGDSEVGIELTAVSYSLWVWLSVRLEYIVWSDLAVDRITPATPARSRLLLQEARASANSTLWPLKALGIVDEIIHELRAIEDPLRLGNALANRVIGLNATGQVEQAREVLAELQALVADLPPSRLKVYALGLAGTLARTTVGRDASRPLHDAAIAAAEAIGADGWVHIYTSVAHTSRTPEDDPDTAIEGLRTDLARVRPTHFMSSDTTATSVSRLIGLLALRGGQGDVEEALRLARVHEKLVGRLEGFGYFLNLGLLALRRGRARDAAKLVGYADAGRAAAGVDNPFSRDRFGQVWSLLHAELSDAELRTLAAEGARLTLDDAWRLAMREV
jgi:predicted ATPase/class 3 adenylate cyclase